MGSQPESNITLPASNQRAASKLSAMPKNLNITHPDEARLPLLPDSIDQPITAMPQSRINARVQPTASLAAIQAHTQVAFSHGVPVSSRTLRRRLAERHLGSRHPLRVLPLTPTHRRLCLDCLEWYHARENWTAVEWNQVVFSDESRFNFSSDDNHGRVWRPRGERLNPSFALQRHTAPTTGGMVWGVIAYNTQSPLVLIRSTMTAQWYVHDILQPHVLPLMQRLP
ncbi:transposable element Tcb2 transposase [Trichonephila clavipes]|nr:transposable element Tcb2 transposase [Trichonephila clavipes]